MPLCHVCNTYFTMRPCPNCTKSTSKKINYTNLPEKKIKNIWLSSNQDELDFIWAQIAKDTIQRVQRNSSILRHGFLHVNAEKLYKFEMVGCTFNVLFSSRLEKLYPGINNIIIVIDIVNQSFSFNLLKEILDDIIIVNRQNLSSLFIMWLAPYLNIQNQYEGFKTDTKSTINEYLLHKTPLKVEELILPMYDSETFSEKLMLFFVKITENPNISNFLHLPLRPLFRSRRNILDPHIANRVVILDLEPIKYANNTNIISDTINYLKPDGIAKCIGCNIVLQDFVKCLTCQSHFCDKCIQELSETDFCLGSIFHGLHRISILR